MRKPIVLIIDQGRHRSPLLTQYYEFLQRKGGPITFYVSDKVNEHVKESVAELPTKPDYIYRGFMPLKGLQSSVDYLNRNRISVITEVGDVNAWGTTINEVQGTDVRLLVYRIPHYDFLPFRVMTYLKREAVPIGGHLKPNPLRTASMVFMPWSIDPSRYKPRTWLTRDIDISLLCSVNSCFTYHDNRRRIRTVLERLQKRGVYNIRINNKLWGDAYTDTLCRTKMFIVDTSMRDFLTQKYLEGPACGCMLLGEVPSCATDDYVHDKTIAESDYDSLEQTIKYYFDHQLLMSQIARRGRDMVMEKYTQAEHIPKVENAILEDFKRRQKK